MTWTGPRSDGFCFTVHPQIPHIYRSPVHPDRGPNRMAFGRAAVNVPAVGVACGRGASPIAGRPGSWWRVRFGRRLWRGSRSRWPLPETGRDDATGNGDTRVEKKRVGCQQRRPDAKTAVASGDRSRPIQRPVGKKPSPARTRPPSPVLNPRTPTTCPPPADRHRKAPVSIEAGASVVLSGSVLLGSRRVFQVISRRKYLLPDAAVVILLVSRRMLQGGL